MGDQNPEPVDETMSGKEQVSNTISYNKSADINKTIKRKLNK